MHFAILYIMFFSALALARPVDENVNEHLANRVCFNPAVYERCINVRTWDSCFSSRDLVYKSHNN
jgi:hypothetical protein